MPDTHSHSTPGPIDAARQPRAPLGPGQSLPEHAPRERVTYDPGTDATFINVTAQFPVEELTVSTVDWTEYHAELLGLLVHLVGGRIGVVEVIGCHQLLGDDFCRRAVTGAGADLVRVVEEGALTRLAFATDPHATVSPVAEVARGGSARPDHLDSPEVSADLEYHPNGTLRTLFLTVH